MSAQLSNGPDSDATATVCVTCKANHLDCDGDMPCNQCSELDSECKYPSTADSGVPDPLNSSNRSQFSISIHESAEITDTVVNGLSSATGVQSELLQTDSQQQKTSNSASLQQQVGAQSDPQRYFSPQGSAPASASEPRSIAGSGGFGPELLSDEEGEQEVVTVQLSSEADIIRHVAQDLDERTQTLLSLTCKQWFEGRPEKPAYDAMDAESSDIDYRGIFDKGESPWEVPLDGTEVSGTADQPAYDTYDYDIDMLDEVDDDRSNHYVSYGNDAGYDESRDDDLVLVGEPTPVRMTVPAPGTFKKKRKAPQPLEDTSGLPHQPSKKRSKLKDSGPPPLVFSFPRSNLCERCGQGPPKLENCTTCVACWHPSCVFPPIAKQMEKFRCRYCILSSPPLVLGMKWQWDPTTSSHKKMWLFRRAGLSYLHSSWVDEASLDQTELNTAYSWNPPEGIEPPTEPRDYCLFSKRRQAKYSRVERFGGIPPQWTTIERILSSTDNIEWQSHDRPEDKKLYLIKWEELDYSEVSWEKPSHLGPGWQRHLEAYEKRLDYASLRRVQVNASALRHSSARQPLSASNLPVALPPYALTAANWLRSAWFEESDPKKRSLILADDAQLSKHTSILAFLKSIFDDGTCIGPVAIFTPHQVEMFAYIRQWLPNVDTVLLPERHGLQVFADYETDFSTSGRRPLFQIVVCNSSPPLIPALDEIVWDLVVVDINPASKPTKLPPSNSRMKILSVDAAPRHDMIILKWLLPHCATAKDQFDFSPYVMRRTVNDLFSAGMLKKRELLVGVNMTDYQRQLFRSRLEDHAQQLRFFFSTRRWDFCDLFKKIWKDIRRDMTHPFLDSEAEKKCTIPPPELNRLVQSCGKLQLLDQLLPALQSSGRRVLILAKNQNYELLVDILDDFLSLRQIPFARIEKNSLTADENLQIITAFNRGEAGRFVFLAELEQTNPRISDLNVDTIVFFNALEFPHRQVLDALAKITIPHDRPLLFLRLVVKDSPEECYLRYRATVPTTPSRTGQWVLREKDPPYVECHHILSRGAQDAFQNATLTPKPEPGTVGWEPNLISAAEIAAILDVSGPEDEKLDEFTTMTSDFKVSDADYRLQFDTSESALQEFWTNLLPGDAIRENFGRRAGQLAGHRLRQEVSESPASEPATALAARPDSQPKPRAGSGPTPPPASNGSLPPVKLTISTGRTKNLSAKRSSSRPSAGPSSMPKAPPKRPALTVHHPSPVSYPSPSPLSSSMDSEPAEPSSAYEALPPTAQPDVVPPEFQRPLPQDRIRSAILSLSQDDIHSLAFNGTTENAELNALGIRTTVDFFRQILMTRTKRPTLFEEHDREDLAELASLNKFERFTSADRRSVEALLTRYGVDIPRSIVPEPVGWFSVLNHLNETSLVNRKDSMTVQHYANACVADALANHSQESNLTFEKIGILSLIRGKIREEPFVILDCELQDEWEYFKSAWSSEKDRNLLIGLVKHGRWVMDKIMNDPELFDRREVEKFMALKAEPVSSKDASSGRLFEDAQVSKFLRDRCIQLEKAILAEALYLEELKKAGFPEDAFEPVDGTPRESNDEPEIPPDDHPETEGDLQLELPTAFSEARLPSPAPNDISSNIDIDKASEGEIPMSSSDDDTPAPTPAIQAPIPTRAGVIAPRIASPLSPNLPSFVVRVPTAPDADAHVFRSTNSAFSSN